MNDKKDPFGLQFLDWLLGAPTDDVQRFVPVLLVVIAVLVSIVAVLVATRL